VVVSPFVGQRLRSFLSRSRGADLVVLKELLEAGMLTPVIDRTLRCVRPRRRSGMSASGPPRGRPSSPCELPADALTTGSGA
jgi:hypothetical protein